MSVETGGGPNVNSALIGRATGLILRPRSEWEVIDPEVTSTQSLYTGYVMILAAIPAVMGLLGGLFMSSMMGFMGGFMGIRVGISPVFVVVNAVVQYGLSLVMVFVLALLIDALAPSFDATRSRSQAMKVAAYAPTAVWVASLATIVPLLGLLVVLAAAVYTIYVFHLGLRQLMKAPEDKGVGYTAVVIIVGCIAALLIGYVVNLPVGMMTARSMFVGGARPNVSITLPGGKAQVNVNDLTAAAQAISDQAKAVRNGTARPATDPATLQALLPASLPGYSRSEVSSGGGSVGMMNGSQASGTYEKGDSRIKLSVTDLGVAGAMASMVKVNANRETATSYEKVSSAGGRTTTEEYHRDTDSGKYSVIVGSRYAVEAEGTKVSMDEMKAAVGAIAADKLESLAKG